MPRAEEVWDRFRNDPNDSMSDHMDYLRELGRRSHRILEIGVREGSSTAAFILGQRESGGHLWSVDINPRCGQSIDESGDRWTFIGEDSRNVDHIADLLPGHFDVLLIDGWHDAEFVRSDLRNYAPLVRPGGMILMHDVAPSINITPEMMARGWHDLSGVRPAFDDFLRETKYAGWIQPGLFGLGVIQKTRVLIGVLSCQRDLALNQALRETCYAGKDYHRFFLGCSGELRSPVGDHRSPLQPDTVLLDCPDDYEHLAHKTQALCHWALAQGYDQLFKTDADTYLDVPRLMRAVQEPPVARLDYCGFFKGGPGGALPNYASGLGYWLSRRAMEIVAELPLRYPESVRNPEPFLAEDRWVGHWLFEHGVAQTYDERYRLIDPGPEPGNDVIAVHRQNTPEKIHALHARAKAKA